MEKIHSKQIMLNRVILMGRLVSDPELKTTPAGVNVTSFRIAVERSYVKQGEERKADFFDIVCWRNQADFVCRYFKKGSLIAVEGQLQSRTYQAKDGTNRYVVEVVADNISFTGERRDNSTSATTQPPTAAPATPATPATPASTAAPAAAPAGDFADFDFGDLPFDV